MRAWAIGVYYGEQYVWPDFIANNTACIGEDPDEPPRFPELMNEIKVGDLIIARSTYQYATMYVRGIGVCTQTAQINHPANLGHCIDVNWLISGDQNNEILHLFDFGNPDRIVELPGHVKRDVINWVMINHPNAYRIIKRKEIEQALDLLTYTRQVIFAGPPGTSKTYEAKKLCAGILGLSPQAAIDNLDIDFDAFNDFRGTRWNITQFHPAYNYEDFVRGIQISTNEDGQVQYNTANRVFSNLCKLALHDPKSKFVLIIDEINRANLAAVLGELIYGLEYRGQPVRTPYEVDGSFDLIVPENLYIIGTMNTADRSIGHIDYAVRRRFAFVPMMPDQKFIKQTVATHGDLQKSALQLYDAVASLFSGGNAQLTSDFFADDVQPGHTYFLAESCDELLTKFVYQVLPLLHEYVKDGVLNPKANLTIGNPPIQLGQPIRPTIIAEQLRGTLPCFLNQPDADVANGAE